MSDERRIRDFALPPEVSKVVGVYVNGVPQAPRRDYRIEDGVVHLRGAVRPFQEVGTVGNILTALCATVLPAGDEVDAIIETRDGRRVVRLAPTAT